MYSERVKQGNGLCKLCDEGRNGWTDKPENNGTGSQKEQGDSPAPGGCCNRQRELLDISAGLAATFPISVTQHIISLLDKVEGCLLCRLPGCLPSKPVLSSQQPEAWLPSASAGLFLAFHCPLRFLARSRCSQAAG